MVRGSSVTPLSEPDLVDHCKVGPYGVKPSGYRKFGPLIIPLFSYPFLAENPIAGENNQTGTNIFGPNHVPIIF